MAVLLPPSESEEITVKAVMSGAGFVTRGSVAKVPGWREAYDTGYVDLDEETESVIKFTQAPPALSTWKKGNHIHVDRLEITEGRTKPPAYFTEGTLIAAMENPAKYMTQKDVVKARTLGETGGLGTVATRADIIEKLFGSFLMEKKGNEIHTTSKGRQLLELVPKDLKTPELTADWELRLQAISKGCEKDSHFMAEIEDYTKTLIQEISTANGS